jgi:hypothetical protein
MGNVAQNINNNLKAIFDIADELYLALISNINGVVPEDIEKPTDIDIGAIASQQEYLRRVSLGLQKQIYIDQSSGEFLKYTLEQFFNSIRLAGETDEDWINRTITNVFNPKVSHASFIVALRPYSTLDPLIENFISFGAFAGVSFAGRYRLFTANWEGNQRRVYPAIARSLSSSLFTIRITLYNTLSENINTVINIIENIIAAGISYELVIIYPYSTWTAIAAPENNLWRSVAYGNGVFVSVADSGTNKIMRSVDDGLTWSPIAAPGNSTWRSVTYGSGVFVSVASSGSPKIMRSVDDGLTWSPIAAPEANSWRSVTYGNGVFVSVASFGTNRIMRSVDDGLTWVSIAAPEANGWGSVAYGNGVFVSAADFGTNRIMRSVDDGLTWSPIAAPEANGWHSVAYGNGGFVAVATNGTNRIMRSVFY